MIATAAASVPDGVTAVTYDGIGDLPHFNPDLDPDLLPPSVVELRRLIDEVSALLFNPPAILDRSGGDLDRRQSSCTVAASGSSPKCLVSS